MAQQAHGKEIANGKPFLTDVKTLRARAREHLEDFDFEGLVAHRLLCKMHQVDRTDLGGARPLRIIRRFERDTDCCHVPNSRLYPRG